MVGQAAFKHLTACRARQFLMLFKRFVKFLSVYLHAVFAGQLFGQFDRKAEGIVEAERNAAGNNLCGIFH